MNWTGFHIAERSPLKILFFFTRVFNNTVHHTLNIWSSAGGEVPNISLRQVCPLTWSVCLTERERGGFVDLAQRWSLVWAAVTRCTSAVVVVVLMRYFPSLALPPTGPFVYECVRARVCVYECVSTVSDVGPWILGIWFRPNVPAQLVTGACETHECKHV